MTWAAKQSRAEQRAEHSAGERRRRRRSREGSKEEGSDGICSFAFASGLA
jgi:hypothetical protein